MGLRIGTNVAAISAQRQLGKSQAQTEHAMKALSSGSRIVSAGDDAAGFAISEILRAQASSLKQAKNNSENAKGLIQVAEGGLNEQNNILIRLRELALQSASDTVGDDERDYLNTEFTGLTSEIDRIAKTTTFGSKKLLQGGSQEYEFHVGSGNKSEDIISYTMGADTTGSSLGTSGLTISDRSDAKSNLEDIDSAMTKIAKARASFGAIQSRLEIAGNNLDTQYENVTDARGKITDADIAYETSELARGQVLKDFGVSVLAQANQDPQRVLKLL